MSNTLIRVRNDLIGWRFVIWDEIQQDIIRDEAGSGLEWQTEAEAINHLRTVPKYADFAPQEIMEGNTVPDVFSGNIQLPETIIVCGAGPSLQEGLDRVDDDAVVVACNSAINYSFPYRYWLAFDHRVVDYPWWNTLRVPDGCEVIFGSRLVNRLRLIPEEAKHAPDWYYNYMPPVDRATKRGTFLQPGYLRGGMNVLGCALQFGYWFGAKRILLSGCDQWGPGHWDGFVNPDTFGSHRLHWNTIMRLGALVEELGRAGVKVQSLTDTAIAGVERI